MIEEKQERLVQRMEIYDRSVGFSSPYSVVSRRCKKAWGEDVEVSWPGSSVVFMYALSYNQSRFKDLLVPQPELRWGAGTTSNERRFDK